MKQITLRNVEPELARALEAEKRRRGLSLNATVLGLLKHALGVEGDRPYSNGLADLAGTWSPEEFREFEEATEDFRRVDDELWK